MAAKVALLLLWCSFLGGSVVAQPPLGAVEQEAVYEVLRSVNAAVPWRSDFPDDLCYSAPHGVVCEYFNESGVLSAHITELNFGTVSEYSPNPPCSPEAVLNASLFSAFTHLTKLFFYRCFADSGRVLFPDFSSVGSSLQELVFIENPSLVGTLAGKLEKMKSLRRLVITGTGITGEIPDGLGDLVSLEQLMLSRNRFTGEVSVNFRKLKNLKVLDLSENGFSGNIPVSLGNGSSELVKLDLGSNGFSGEIPASLVGLQKLEFLDLSYNRFNNSGVPLFLGEMASLKEVYLNGNFLGGKIPDIWGNLKNILAIGLSGNGLTGMIPPSLVSGSRNLCFLGLDSNNLEGELPEEFGALESFCELNLQNNNLSGKVPFSAKFVGQIGIKLKLQGNPELCAEGDEMRPLQLRLCSKKELAMPEYASFTGGDSARKSCSSGSWIMLSAVILMLSLC